VRERRRRGRCSVTRRVVSPSRGNDRCVERSGVLTTEPSSLTVTVRSAGVRVRRDRRPVLRSKYMNRRGPSCPETRARVTPARARSGRSAPTAAAVLRRERPCRRAGTYPRIGRDGTSKPSSDRRRSVAASSRPASKRSAAPLTALTTAAHEASPLRSPPARAAVAITSACHTSRRAATTSAPQRRREPRREALRACWSSSRSLRATGRVEPDVGCEEPEKEGRRRGSSTS